VILAVEVVTEVFAFVAGVFMLLLTVGTGMAAWALRELVRLTNAVTKLEQMVVGLAEERVDHDRRLTALELYHWKKDTEAR
jgi:hypothetical protein